MNTLKSIISVVLVGVILLRFSIPVSATSATSTDIYNMLYSGFQASSALEDVADELDNNISFYFDEMDYSDFNNAWIADAKAFVDAYNDSNTRSSQANTLDTVTAEQAKAASLAYSIECAMWSVNKGRGNNVGDETVYMFISHYVDRAEYYWDNENYQYLMDGPSMSENPSYFSKWIVSYDRTVYDTYIQQAGITDTTQKMKNIALGVYSMHNDLTDVSKLTADFDRISTVAATYKLALINAQFDIDTYGAGEDLEYIVNEILEDGGETDIDDIYYLFVEDDDLLHDFDSATREELILGTVSLTISVMLSGIEGAVSTIGLSMLSFTIDMYMDLFKFAMWVNMRNSFTYREPWRYNDYLYDMYF